MSESKPLGRAGALWLLAILLIGFGARIAFVEAQPKGWFRQGDWNWVRMADGLRSGEGLVIDDRRIVVGPMRAHKMPLYAYLVAGSFEVFGRRGLPIVAIQAALGALAALLAFLVGRRLAGPGAGLASAAVVAFYPYSVAIDAQMGEHVLSVVLLLASALFLERWTDGRRWPDLVGFGLLAGATLLTRWSLVLLLGPACLFLVVGRRPGLGSRCAAVAGAGLVIGLCLVPWVLRNRALLGRPVVLTGSGRSLWIGNNDVMQRAYPGVSADEVEREMWEKADPAFREEIGRLGEIEREEVFRREAERWIVEDPVRSLRFAGFKVLATMGPVYNPTRRAGYAKLAILALTYLAVLLLGLGGVRRIRWRGGSAFPWFTLLLGMAIAAQAAIFWGHTRHRLPFDVCLAVLAGPAIHAWVVSRRDRGDRSQSPS